MLLQKDGNCLSGELRRGQLAARSLPDQLGDPSMLPGDLDTLEKLENRRSRFLGLYKKETFQRFNLVDFAIPLRLAAVVLCPCFCTLPCAGQTHIFSPRIHLEKILLCDWRDNEAERTCLPACLLSLKCDGPLRLMKTSSLYSWMKRLVLVERSICDILSSASKCSQSIPLQCLPFFPSPSIQVHFLSLVYLSQMSQ